MAIALISGNLNTWGNNGQFETDPSTWGYSGTRTNEQKSAGLYSSKFVASGAWGILFTGSDLAFANFTPENGKKYVAKAKVRSKGSQRPAHNDALFSILPAGQAATYQVNKTVALTADVWSSLEVRWTHDTSAIDVFGLGYRVRLSVATFDDLFLGVNLIEGGIAYIDEFEIYEYEDIDESLVCDVEIDPEATVVVNETNEGDEDGSITVSATGTGILEYSKNGGATWQLSNVFAGLGTGIYVVRVRQQANITCYDEYPFVINFDDVTHDFTTAVTDESFAGLEDGSIAITPTGTGGPFEYSIDAGVTFQAGNLFEGLAPGTYYVVVRNAAGNSVLHLAVVAAGSAAIDKTYHSKNPITIGKAAPSGWEESLNLRLYNDVRVEDVADSGTYVSKLKVDLPPDSTGLVTFYLNEAFRDVFTFVPPSLNENLISRLTDRIKRFKNFSGVVQNTEVTPEELTASSANLVLWGGVSKFHFPTLQYFTDYIVTNKKFLTWAPIEKYVDRLQEDYLNFWCYGNFTTLKLRVKVYFDDATNSTSTITTLVGTTFTNLYRVPAGPANTGVLLIDPEKNVLYYELWLTNQDDEVITEVRTYHIEKVSHPRTRFFMFRNSLGGDEVLRFTGVQTDKVTFVREIIQKFLPHNYNPLDGEFTNSQITRQRQKSISSGMIENKLAKEWHEYLEDFIGSPVVYDVTDGNRYPIVITSGDLPMEDQNYERFIRVEARDAYDNESFTPKDI